LRAEQLIEVHRELPNAFTNGIMKQEREAAP
jgi:hypothetical protein